MFEKSLPKRFYLSKYNITSIRDKTYLFYFDKNILLGVMFTNILRPLTLDLSYDSYKS